MVNSKNFHNIVQQRADATLNCVQQFTMKLGIKEMLAVSALAIGCNPQKIPAPLIAQPIEECRARALTLIKGFNDFANSTGVRIGSWDFVPGEEWRACLKEKGLPPDTQLVQ